MAISHSTQKLNLLGIWSSLQRKETPQINVFLQVLVIPNWSQGNQIYTQFQRKRLITDQFGGKMGSKAWETQKPPLELKYHNLYSIQLWRLLNTRLIMIICTFALYQNHMKSLLNANSKPLKQQYITCKARIPLLSRVPRKTMKNLRDLKHPNQSSKYQSQNRKLCPNSPSHVKASSTKKDPDLPL